MRQQGDIGERFGLCRDIALRSDESTPADLAEHRALIAREYARAESRRRGDTPQASLPLDEAA